MRVRLNDYYYPGTGEEVSKELDRLLCRLHGSEYLPDQRREAT